MANFLKRCTESDLSEEAAGDEEEQAVEAQPLIERSAQIRHDKATRIEPFSIEPAESSQVKNILKNIIRWEEYLSIVTIVVSRQSKQV